MKIKIDSLHIENDVVNNEPRLILTTEDGTEYVMSHESVCMEGGGRTVIRKKSEDWYFDEKNKKK